MMLAMLMALVALEPVGGVQEAALTKESLARLEEQCQIHAKNDNKRYVLLTGLLEQARFEGPRKPSCNPVEEGEPCRAHHWMPPRFSGHFVKTNHYMPKQKVVLHIRNLPPLQMRSLQMQVGTPYAICAKPLEFRRGRPHFALTRFEGLYRLQPASQ